MMDSGTAVHVSKVHEQGYLELDMVDDGSSATPSMAA